MHEDLVKTEAKTAYATPQLIVFGGVAELTASGSSGQAESMQSMSMQPRRP